ncbi:MAG: hypothetical protein R3B06_14575 [Kofleriaceae bacterium]
MTRIGLVSLSLITLSSAADASPRRRMLNQERERRAEEATVDDDGPGNGRAQRLAGCGELRIEAVWAGISVGQPWHRGEPLGADLIGCAGDDELTYAWSVEGGEVVGGGQRVNVLAEASTVALTACVQRDDEAADCAQLVVPAAPPRPRVTIDGVVTLLPGPGGRWARAYGTVADAAAPGALAVRVFKHTDVYYPAAPPVAVDADGTWQVDFWMASNVNTIDAVATAEPVELATQPGCTASWCFGQVDAVTRRRSPLAVDGTTAVATARHLLMGGAATDALAYLRAQRVPLATGALVRSSLDSDALFVYDQAVVAAAFALAGQQADARDILDALVALQRGDGSFAFSYRRSGAAAVEVAPEVSYAGANAWVALAMNAYDGRFGTTTYRAAAERLTDYLASQLIDADAGRAVRFNPVDLPTTPWREPELTAVEHALETLAAFEGAADLGARRNRTAIRDLTAYLRARWAGDHFRPGYYLPAGENTAELYLDTQALAVLAWRGAGTMTHGMSFNCTTFAASAGFLGSGELGLTGFVDFVWADETRAAPYIWAEGTAMMATALGVAEREDRCPTGAAVLAGIADLSLAPQTTSFPATTVGRYNSYGQRSSVSAAAWVVIAASGGNPLRP